MGSVSKDTVDKLFGNWRELFEEQQLEKFRQSWFHQMRPERKHRLKYVVKLGAELERIREVSIQSTAFGKGVIEQLIEGDYKEMAEYERTMFNFELEAGQRGPDWADWVTKHVELWKKFRAITREAIAMRPSGETDPGTRH